ncbi:MAG: hypothetical protein ACXACR_17770, partial [Candidatus Hodarchaeales archaeon]
MISNSSETITAAGCVELEDDVSYYKYWHQFARYKYVNGYTLGPNDYHLVWIRPDDPNSFNPDLYLYDNYVEDYANLYGSSKNMNSSLYKTDWVVYRGGGDIYPWIETGPTYGMNYAYIELESAEDLTVGGDSYWFGLSWLERGTLAQVDLSSDNYYQVLLDVPELADFDLYVLKVDVGYAGTSSLNWGDCCAAYDQQWSTSGGIGEDETIIFKPSTTGKYAIVALCEEGSGRGSLRVDKHYPYRPRLQNISVSHWRGLENKNCTVRVNYSDPNNTPPTYVRLISTGMSPQNMTQEDLGDVDYTDGCIYRFEDLLRAGWQSFYIEASNGTEMILYPENGNITAPLVNNPPTLTDG